MSFFLINVFMLLIPNHVVVGGGGANTPTLATLAGSLPCASLLNDTPEILIQSLNFIQELFFVFHCDMRLEKYFSTI